MDDPAPPRERERIPAAAAWFAVAVLVAWSAWQRWRLLGESPFPLGIDGYVYPVQLRALLAHGTLQYPTSPLAFYLLAPFAAATDPLTGSKLGAAVLGALVAVPAYGVGARLGGSRGAGLLAAVLAAASAGSTYMTIEFVKNGIGLTVALAAIWVGLAACAQPTRRRYLAALLALAAAAATHKMAFGIALAVVAPATLAEAVGRGVLRGRRLIYAMLAVGGAVAAVLLVGLLAPQRVLSPADLQLVHGLVSPYPSWQLPALVAPELVLPMGHEPLLGGVLALLAGTALVLRRVSRVLPGALPGSPAERAATGALVLLALAIALPWLDVTDPQGLAFRLRVAAYVPLALLAAACIRALPLRSFGSPVAAALALGLAIAMPPATDRADGRVVTHPALASAALALVGQLPEGATLVVPERHVAFMAAWYTGAQVALQPDELPRAHRYRLLPLAFIGPGSPLDRALTDARREPALEAPLGVHARHPNGLVLVAEPTWDWVLTRLPPADRDYFAAWPTI